MEPKVHRFHVQVQKEHLDSYGHINNAVYLNLFEQARWDKVNTEGYGLKRIEETGVGHTILEIQIKFRKELRLGQDITIETHAEPIHSKLVLIHQRMLDEQGAECCKAEFKCGAFDIQNRKLIIPSPEWLKAVGIEPVEPKSKSV